jgi:hypothetical protein
VRKLLVAFGLALALVLAALAGVERVAGRHPSADGPVRTPAAEPSLPSVGEAGDTEPAASPALTR